MLKSFPQIKVCGITRPSDAILAAKLGAEYLGLITYNKSPRKVNQKLARLIIAATTPTVQFVLVFVNEAPEKVISLARRLRCAIVQLHGSYTDKEVATIQRAGLKVIRAFQIGDSSDLNSAIKSQADFVLLDNKKSGDKSSYGGTGESFNWKLLKNKSARPQNLIIAGGLSINNFEAALEIASPLVLDFNSSVESSPGIKSAAKLKRLFGALQKRRQSHVQQY